MDIISRAGEFLTELGLFLTPFSFISYIIISWLIYIWDQLPYHKLVKVIWYLAAAFYEITDDEDFYIFVVLLIFMDIVDSVFEFLVEKRNRKDNFD